MRVLIIEDDREIAELERDYLEINGYSCDITGDGESGLKMALENNYALVLVDVMLPRRDGFSVCTEIRRSLDVPIIFLSARTEDIDKVRGLGLGADDYITKPFSPSELVARVKSHISRYDTLSNKAKKQQNDAIKIQNLKIDKDARRVYIHGNEVVMPVKEYELLLFLVENSNIVFSKDRLFERIWGFDSLGDPSTVTVHIQRVRDKINKYDPDVKYIETVWGAGYRALSSDS